MTEQPRRMPWVLLCPHRRVRAELELEVEGGRAVVRGCSVGTWSTRRSCDQDCLRWFGQAQDETPDAGGVVS